MKMRNNSVNVEYTKSDYELMTQINSENKKYMDSVITNSNSYDEVKVNFTNEERKIISATEYNMSLEVDINEKVLSGNSKIKIKNNTNESVSYVIIRNYAASILKSKNKGKSILSNFKDEKGIPLNSIIEEDESIIRVELSKRLQPKDEISISFDFQTDIPNQKDRFGYTSYNNNLIFQLSFCFPSLAIYEDGKWNKSPFILSGAEANYTTVADYLVNVSVPNGYTLIATGEEKKDKNNNYNISGKTLREFAMVIGNNITKSSTTYNGVSINNYYYNYEGNKKYNDYSLKIATESFELYSNLIGEYPFKELDIVSVFMDSAMEYSGLILIGYPDVGPGGLEELDKRKQYKHILEHISHEVAHQWFYGVIGNDPYNEAWLDESFAEFFEQFVFPISGSKIILDIECEKEGNIGTPLMLFEEYYKLKNSMLEQRNQDKFINLSYENYDKKKDEYSYYVYQGGSYFLFELEQAMGEEKFFSMIQRYYKKYKFNEVKTNDFIEFVRMFDNSEQINKIIEKYIYNKK